MPETYKLNKCPEHQLNEDKNISFLLTEHQTWLNRDKKFSSAINKFITEINTLIKQYNAAQNDHEKLNSLNDMSLKIKHIGSKFPPGHYANSTLYQQMTSRLFSEIQSQRVKLGKNSMLDTNSSPLSELIANMSPNKLDQFASVLSNAWEFGWQKKLEPLYKDDESSAESIRFTDFMHSHTFELLDTGFNSRNFKVTDSKGQSEVLKLDNHLSHPYNIEETLYERNIEGLAPIKAVRPIYCNVERTPPKVTEKDAPEPIKQLLSSIVVTEYCEAGSVLEYRQKQLSHGNMLDLCIAACDIGVKMAQTLTRLEENNIYFSDSKLTNWLLKEGQLLIADTKSFLRSAEGRYFEGIKENEYRSVLSTRPFFHPQINDTDGFSVSRVHAYLLGLNLYSILSNSPPKFINMDLIEKEKITSDLSNPSLQIDFTSDILWMADELKPLIDIINQLTMTNAELRPTTEAAQAILETAKLNRLEMPKLLFDDLLEFTKDDILKTELKNGFNNSKNSVQLTPGQLTDEIKKLLKLLTPLKNMTFGDEDHHMNAFIDKALRECTQENTERRSKAFSEIAALIQKLESQNIPQVADHAKNLKSSARSPSRASNKANGSLIETLMSGLTLEERQIFYEHPICAEVAEIFKKTMARLDEVKGENTSESYNQYKNKYHALKKSGTASDLALASSNDNLIEEDSDSLLNSTRIKP